MKNVSINQIRTSFVSMLDKKSIQFKHENETWMRTLDYFQQENIYLKNRLAQIAKTNINNNFLNNLEIFQTRFVEKDTILSILRHDIAEQNAYINSPNNIDNSDFSYTVILQQNKLREDMKQMEKEFNKLKFEFNNYLANVLQ